MAFTGSTKVGHLIQQYSAESNSKRVTLELGGKSPMLVFDDADLDQAADAAHTGLFLNQGQCCCAGSQLLFKTPSMMLLLKCIERAKKIKVGPQFYESTQGPQVDKFQFDTVLRYLAKGKEEGATVKAGGDRHGEKGYYVQPTIFTDVTDEMVSAKEEIFGTVMSILKFSTVEEVIERHRPSSS